MFCLLDVTVEWRVSVNPVCGTLLYLNILLLVLNLLLIAGLAICLTPLWVVARMVSSALFREIFQFFASVAGDSPCLFVVLVNDIVLLQEDSAFRAEWRLARVTEVYPDRRGNVRNVQVQVKPKQDSTANYKPSKGYRPTIFHV